MKQLCRVRPFIVGHASGHPSKDPNLPHWAATELWSYYPSGIPEHLILFMVLLLPPPSDTEAFREQCWFSPTMSKSWALPEPLHEQGEVDPLMSLT